MKMRVVGLVVVAMLAQRAVVAEERAVRTFERQKLTGTYFSEGANAGDINGDGKMDVVYGPYWFEGPSFETKHEIYPPKPQNMEGYADNFFSWVRDFNNDGASDVFVVGFPGTPAYVYENPKGEGLNKHWRKHKVFDSVSNESPQMVDIVGDSRPELVCTTNGAFGFATIDWENGLKPWTFHRISDQAAPEKFGHGLGVGDVNGDGRIDVLVANGWFEQPKDASLDSHWVFHPVAFTNAYGGAEMYAYDVDGDGDNDVITTLAAHDFGLAWYEQVRKGSDISFKQHLIMGNRPGQNRYGLVFSELHSLALVDVDQDGLKDLVTGKTYYSHHKQSPLWDAGAVVYWFRLARTKSGVDYVPYKADGEAGIGRQVSIADVNGDKLPDIVVGGMKGAHVLIQKKKDVSEAEYEKAQPKPVTIPETPALRGPASKMDEATRKVAGAIEGESLKVLSKSAGRTSTQPMRGFKAGRWSGDSQLFWNGAKVGDRLELEFPVSESSDQDVNILAAFTMAADYATVRVELDGKTIGKPLDLYNDPDVVQSGELNLGRATLEPGSHRLAFVIVGANPAAARAYMLGLDYIRLEK